MQDITEELLEKDTYLLYIHTPFCGTCHIARHILEQIESVLEKEIFFEMNASFYPSFMEDFKIESVPCLLIKHKGEIKEKVYTFHSTANILYFITAHIRDLTEIELP